MCVRYVHRTPRMPVLPWKKVDMAIHTDRGVRMCTRMSVDMLSQWDTQWSSFGRRSWVCGMLARCVRPVRGWRMLGSVLLLLCPCACLSSFWSCVPFQGSRPKGSDGNAMKHVPSHSALQPRVRPGPVPDAALALPSGGVEHPLT